MKVHIAIDASEGALAMAVEYRIPKGWRVTVISDNGEWDGFYRKVKWGPFLEDLSRTVSFEVHRDMDMPTIDPRWLGGEKWVNGFSGTVSFDGVNHPIATGWTMKK